MRSARILLCMAVLCVQQLSVYMEFPNFDHMSDEVKSMTHEHFTKVEQLRKKTLDDSFGYAPPTTKEEIDIEKMIATHVKEDVETRVFEEIKILKQLAVENGMKNPDKFLRVHETGVLEEDKKSDLYLFLKSLPKGADGHVHSTFMGNLDTLVKMPTKDFCKEDYGKIYVLHTPNDELDIKGFEVSNNAPKPIKDLQYSKLEAVVGKHGEEKFLDHFKQRLTLKNKSYKHIGEVWAAMDNIFPMLKRLLNYKPFLKEYIKRSLADMMNDNIQYVEIRATLGLAYDLYGDISPEKAFQIYKDACQEFTNANKNGEDPKMVVKFILTGATQKPNKKDHEDFFTLYANLVKEDKKEKGSRFLIGFDLAGPEEFASKSTPMLNLYVPYIKKLMTDSETKDVKFYFHAGQTKIFNIYDENLYDAVLLADRIGHGFSLNKHSSLMKFAKDNNKCFEISLNTNMMMHLNNDLQSHPMSEMLTNNVQMVLTTENRALVDASMTDEFYLAFVHVAAYEMDMRILKKLILNSFRYSGMNEEERNKAVNAWAVKYSSWLDDTDKKLSQKKVANKKTLDQLAQARHPFGKPVKA